MLDLITLLWSSARVTAGLSSFFASGCFPVSSSYLLQHSLAASAGLLPHDLFSDASWLLHHQSPVLVLVGFTVIITVVAPVLTSHLRQLITLLQVVLSCFSLLEELFFDGDSTFIFRCICIGNLFLRF